MRRVSLFAALFVALSAAPSMAQEEGGNPFKAQGGLLDASPQERHNILTSFLGFPYVSAPGFPIALGARFYIPLVKDGFIPALNDEFGIEFGADVGLGTGYSFFGFANRGLAFGFDIPVHALWAFNLTPQWTAYATLGLAVHLWWWGGEFYGWPVYPEGGVGAMWRIAEGWTLRAEVGTGFRIGLAWAF